MCWMCWSSRLETAGAVELCEGSAPELSSPAKLTRVPELGLLTDETTLHLFPEFIYGIKLTMVCY